MTERGGDEGAGMFGGVEATEKLMLLWASEGGRGHKGDTEARDARQTKTTRPDFLRSGPKLDCVWIRIFATPNCDPWTKLRRDLRSRGAVTFFSFVSSSCQGPHQGPPRDSF